MKYNISLKGDKLMYWCETEPDETYMRPPYKYTFWIFKKKH